MPQRIQLSRRKGWRKPEGAIVVAWPSRWGNPYAVYRTSFGHWAVSGAGVYRSKVDAVAKSVELFRHYHPDVLDLINGHDRERWLAPLRGHDLCCWCPLDSPCHADVLLELANGDGA